MADWPQYQVPTSDLKPSIDIHLLVMNLHDQKKHSEKADKFTLTSGDSKHR